MLPQLRFTLTRRGSMIGERHKSLVGTPKFAFYTRPARRSQLHVGTQKNVIALLGLKTGEFVWRQVLEPSDDLSTLSLGEHGLLSISGTSSVHTRLWDSSTGFLLWDHVSSTDGDHGATEVAYHEGDALTLVHGKTITRIDIAEGTLSWTLDLEPGYNYDDTHIPVLAPHALSSRVTYGRIFVHQDSLYAIGTNAASEISVIVLDPATGKSKADYQPPNGKVKDLKEIYFLDGGEQAFMYWNGPDRSYRQILGKSSDVEELEEYEGASVVNVFGSTLVLRGDKGFAFARNPEKIHSTFGEEASALGHLFAGTRNPDDNYISVVFKSTAENAVKVALYDAGSLKHIDTYTVPFDESKSGPLEQAHLDVFSQKDGSLSLRLFVVTADGSTHLWKDGESLWTQAESLTVSSAAEYVDLPEQSLLSQEHDELDEQPVDTASVSPLERYLRRIRAHAIKFSTYPQRLANFIQQFTMPSSTSQMAELHADFLGVRKLVIFASSTGKIVALDTQSGNPVWEKFFPGLNFTQVETVRASKIKFPPVIALIGHDDQQTILYRLNALNGDAYTEDGAAAMERHSAIQKIIKLPVEEVIGRTHIMALVGDDLKIRVSPSSEAGFGAFREFAPQFFLYLTEGPGSSEISGYSVEDSGKDVFPLKSVWKLDFPDGEVIAAVGSTSPSENSVASLGRVLGDRSVLYKYLNPNLLALATIKTSGGSPFDGEFTSTVFAYLLDTITGTVHYRTEHKGAGHVSPNLNSIFLVQEENWAVLSYWNHGPDAVTQEGADPSADSAEGEETVKKQPRKRKRKTASAAEVGAVPDAKGYEMAVLELFESALPDHRVESDTFSSFQAKRPHVISQSYAFPKRISAIGTTKTGAGITTSEVLVGLQEGHLYGISKRVLDPRRPVGPPTKDEKEEMLYPYRASLDFNPKEVATYNLHVPQIAHILSAPTKMESTSLTIAWGLDVFCGRRNPSKTFDVLSDDFNYIALLGTIAACAVGIVVAKRMANQKKLNDLWK
ncbi:hypothetical protein HKX48_003655 [Thoreauomyces humboldtii]|nr:hypothetical protein HKX48_003655 [Thoreauomyces humboldtii]